MSAFKKFEQDDIFISEIHTAPKISIRYGFQGPDLIEGYEGNVGISGSLSLYGGIRSRMDVKSTDFATSGLSITPLDLVDTHSIDKVILMSGSYPTTGSIRVFWCYDDPAPTSPGTFALGGYWYEEHYRPISLLYEYYSRIDSNYFIGCHDFYMLDTSLRNRSSSLSNGPAFVFPMSYSFAGPTASFTAEIWAKTNSRLLSGSHHTLMSQEDIWKLFVSGSTASPSGTGSLWFMVKSGSTTYELSASGYDITPGHWHHCAAVVSGGASVSLYVDGLLAITGSIPFQMNSGSELKPLIVAGHSKSFGDNYPVETFSGQFFESRLWRTVRTQAQVSSSMTGTLFNSSSLTDLIHYARYNDGPLSTAHGYSAGSGAFDYSNFARHGFMSVPAASLVTNGYYFMPNDHPTFITKYEKITGMSNFKVVNIPSLYYGKEIERRSVRLTMNTFNDGRYMSWVYCDDGRGTLYLSGSVHRPETGQDYTGNERRKVGNVFYSEGLITVIDPDVVKCLGHMTSHNDTLFPDNAFELEFRGSNSIYTKTFNCRLGPGEFNASNNPTFSFIDDGGTVQTDDDRTRPVRSDSTTYVTTIGLYNEDRELVGVAKLAQPIRKREKDKVNIRIKMDF